MKDYRSDCSNRNHNHLVDLYDRLSSGDDAETIRSTIIVAQKYSQEHKIYFHYEKIKLPSINFEIVNRLRKERRRKQNVRIS